MPRLFILLVFQFLVLLSVYPQKPIRDLRPTVILVSIDGFRYDYLDKYRPPTLSKLALGARAKWMVPSFPTKTFPNFYTIATGLRPENHGIIENNIWHFGVLFTTSNVEEKTSSKWWLGEPIWVTAEKQGVRAATYFDVGSEAEIQGTRPTIWKKYDGNIANNDRVDEMLSWLDRPQSERPQLLSLYFSDVDSEAHDNGPESPEVEKAILSVDASIQRLVDGLKARKIAKKVNIVVVSDHGLAPVDQRNAIVVDDYFTEGDVERSVVTGEVLQIFPRPGNEMAIVRSLEAIHHAKCWRKQDIPERLHYHASPRIAPIVCSPDEGWFFTTRARYEKQRQKPDFNKMRGAHGYDNQLESMRATFIAQGPAFKRNFVAEPFDNIHVYELLCMVLGLKPAKNDGSLDAVRGMLR